MNEDVWLDSDIEALEDSIRAHPAKGFKIPRYTHACPACGRKVTAMMLEVPHYAPQSKPICSSCRANYAKWYRSPEQREASRKALERRRELGIAPNPGGFPE